MVDSSFSVFETWERQRMNEELAKDRSEQWLRENIVSELAFVKNQRKLWLAQLEEAKKNGDVEMIARKERDLKFNEKNLVRLQLVYISVRNEKRKAKEIVMKKSQKDLER